MPNAPRPSLTARRATCTRGQAARPRARSFAMRSSRPAVPSALAARQLPGCTHALHGARCPMHPVGASHACSACLPRAMDSIFGMNSGAA